MNFALLIILPMIFCIKIPKVRYDGFKVFRVVPKNVKELKSLHNLRSQNRSYNFWSDANYVNESVDIMIPPSYVNNFKNTLVGMNLNGKLLIENIQALINNQSSDNADNAFDWKTYHTLDEIYKWLMSLPTRYPNVVTLIQGGRSYQKRNITGVKISFKGNKEKKAVFIEGGIHAREWISPATVTYIINEFLTSTDPNVRFAAESRDWYIFPVVNPDGYVYTTKVNRLWRKTRKPYGICFGADPNRNWDYKWFEGGSSDDPCEDTFAGSSPFSEIETKSLSEFIDSIAPSLDGYLSFHSYSQLLLIPFGYAGLEVPENNAQQLRIGQNAADVLAQRYGTQYKVGNIPEMMGIASGSSVDWILGKHRYIKYAYAYELRDTGRYAFLLPPEQIIPTGEETLDSVVSIVKQFHDEENQLK